MKNISQQQDSITLDGIIKFNILKNFKIFAIISVVATILSLALILLYGFNKSVDFAGGFVINASCQSIEKNENNNCIEGIKNFFNNYEKKPSQIKKLDNLIVIEFSSSQVKNINEAEVVKLAIIASNAIEGYKVEILKSDFLMKKFGSQMLKSGIYAILFTLVGIFIYLFIRFSVAFAISAAITLLHDTVMVLGFLSLTKIEMNLSVVAAILTVIGYSVNDSVIIFDRIRSNKSIYGNKLSIFNLISLSASQTLSRTIITSLTTLFSILAIILLAGNAIAGFGYTAFFGILLGTYSSIFVSAPLLLWLKKFDKHFA